MERTETRKLESGQRVSLKGRAGAVVEHHSDGYVEVRFDDNPLGRYVPEQGKNHPEGTRIEYLKILD